MTTLLIIAAFILVFLNGFFVAAEFSIVKLRGSQLDAIKSHGYTGHVLKIIHKHIDEYLSACQLGITLASLGLGWIGEPAFARVFEKLLYNVDLAHALATLSAFILAFFLISYLHIVVGELAPKSLAIRRVEKIALLTAVPLYFFYWAMYPIIWLLNKSANLVLKIFGITTSPVEHSYSADELKVILTASHMHEDLTKDDLRILNRVLEFTDLTVGDLMRPIQELKAVEADQPLAMTLTKISEFHFSRYPIYENSDKEKIVGVLHIKDLLEAIVQNKTIKSILELKRPFLEFGLDAPAIDVFHAFRMGSAHFAIIKNEVDKIVGFITMDDVLSEALGNIRDEFITPHRDWFVTKEGNYILYGYTSLYTLERLLHIDVEDESNTISGLLLSTLGRMPEPNEMINYEHFDVVVLKVTGPKIELVKVIPKKKTAKPAGHFAEH